MSFTQTALEVDRAPPRTIPWRPQRYEDVSNWGSPYDKGIFDECYLGATDVVPGAETPAVVVPETTIIGQCDFVQGGYVDAVHAFLVAKGAMTPAQVQADGSAFGEATCAAWTAYFGRAPTAGELAQSVLKPNETCATLLLPPCAASVEAGFNPTTLLWVGAGLVGVLLVAKALRKR